MTAFNLGVAAVAAKGTTQDYLTYSEAISVRMMTMERVSFGVIKNIGGIKRAADNGLPLRKLHTYSIPDGGAVAPARPESGR